jgi:hypothetical protein
MEIFSEDGSMSESELKLVIDQGREAMKIDRPVAISEVAEQGPLREAQGTRDQSALTSYARRELSFSQ